MQPKAKLYRWRASSPEALLESRSCLFILLMNWLLQGIRGMDGKEISFRLILLAAGTSVLGAGLAWATDWPLSTIAPLALALVHSINFLANGQFWVCLRYCPGYRQDSVLLRQRVERLFDRVAGSAWLDEAVVIGSLARQPQAPGPRSDIDLRLVFPPGWRGWLRTNLLLLELRAWAFVTRLPLDVYAYEHPAVLRRFDQSEPLGILLDRAARLRRGFANRELAWLR